MELYDIAWEYIGRQKRSQPQTQHGNVDLKTSYWLGNMIVLLTLSPFGVLFRTLVHFHGWHHHGTACDFQ